MHWQTHTVFNQPAPLSNSNLFLSDCALRDAVAREGAEWDIELLASIGQQLGTAESLELGRLANVNPPELLRYDATGERLDDVRFHPAWHLLMQGLCANRVHNLAWEEEARKGSFVARAARFVLHAQVEAGTLCPVTMTFAATPLLQQALPKAFHDWLTPLLSDRYDPHLAPGAQKRGLLIGMGMTEKQGGSDVLSNTTKAEKCSDGSYRLVGHKWFFSVPQSDAHLVLAQTIEGPTLDQPAETSPITQDETGQSSARLLGTAAVHAALASIVSPPKDTLIEANDDAPAGEQTAASEDLATGIVPDSRPFQERYPILKCNAL